MNRENIISVDKKGNVRKIEAALTIAVVFYFISIMTYNLTFDILEKNISPKLGWNPWLTRNTVFTSASTFFVLVLRILILKFRIKWTTRHRLLEDGSIHEKILYFLPILDNDDNYNNLQALSRRTRIGYFLIFFSLMSYIVVSIRYLIHIADAPELNNYRFNIYTIHALFFFTFGVINIYFGIETEIKKRFEFWSISNEEGNLTFTRQNNKRKNLLSVNTKGGWCEINGHEYPIKIKGGRNGKLLYIDRSEGTNDESKFIYI